MARGWYSGLTKVVVGAPEALEVVLPCSGSWKAQAIPPLSPDELRLPWLLAAVKALYVISTQLNDALVMHVDVLHIAKALSTQANALTHALTTGKS